MRRVWKLKDGFFRSDEHPAYILEKELARVKCRFDLYQFFPEPIFYFFSGFQWGLGCH